MRLSNPLGRGATIKETTATVSTMATIDSMELLPLASLSCLLWRTLAGGEADFKLRRYSMMVATSSRADAMSARKDDEGADTPSTWLTDNDKYALVGLGVKVAEIPLEQITSHLWVLGETAFKIPPDWREWLGSIRAGEVEDFNLFLLSKLPSRRADLLDDENVRLKQNVWHFYVGLLLASTFTPANKPVMLTGSRQNGEIGIREQLDLDCPIPCVFRPYPQILAKDIYLAAQLGEGIDALTAALLHGGHWRFFRTLHLYTEARTIADNLERLHQYCRCIEGLISPDPGDTKRQFKSRTELFIGPRYHDMIGEIYDVRSAVEHLHEDRYLEPFNRETRLELLKKEAIAEYIARNALVRIVGDRNLWPHFANTSAVRKFWASGQRERRQAWGDPIDPAEAVVDFDPKYISDGQLGAL
jgi:hypothetical protein